MLKGDTAMAGTEEKPTPTPDPRGWDQGTVIDGSDAAYRPMLDRMRPLAERLADEKGWPSEP